MNILKISQNDVVDHDGHSAVTDIRETIIRRNIRKRPHMSFTDLKVFHGHTTDIISEFSPILGEFSDYDGNGMKSQVSLPGFGGTHYAYEETGRLSYGNNQKLYDRNSEEIVLDIYMKQIKKVDKIPSMTIPKGKNTSWPAFISGSDRLLNNFDLLNTTLMVQRAKEQGMTAIELIKMVEKSVGYNLFYGYGERFQHSAKELPFFVHGYYGGHTSNMEPRVRMINMVSKILILFHRDKTKMILKSLMTLPMHLSDKGELDKLIKGKINGDYHVFPVDHSKYDHHVAGAKSKQIRSALQLILERKWNISKSDATNWFKDVMFELSATKVFPFKEDILEYSGMDYLPSGESNTTNHGISGNDFATIQAITSLLRNFNVEMDVHNYSRYIGKEKDFFYQSWGDDTLIFIKKSYGEYDDLLKLLQRGYVTGGHEITEEASVRYLGKIYDIYQGSPIFRFVQTSLGPERSKDSRLFKMGMVLKYDLLDPSVRPFVLDNVLPRLVARLNQVYPKFGKDGIGRGTYVTSPLSVLDFTNPIRKEKIIKEGIIAAETVAGGIQELDQILYSYHHGSDDHEVIMDMLGIDFDMNFTFDTLSDANVDDYRSGKLLNRVSSLRSPHRSSLASEIRKMFKSSSANSNDFHSDLYGHVRVSKLLSNAYNEI